MELIIETICAYFSLEKNNVIEKTNKQTISIARNYIYYILHYEYGYSISQIAKRFNRCKREINYRISEIKYRINYFQSIKKEYQDILQNLNKVKGIE